MPAFGDVLWAHESWQVYASPIPYDRPEFPRPAYCQGLASMAHLRRLLARTTVLPTDSAHFEEAAALFRRCRQEGESVRRLMDCLIAAVAIRSRAPVLHRDGDFDTLARHTQLEIAR